MTDNDEPKSHMVGWSDEFRLLTECGMCRWKHGGSATCEAFPSGIPHAILAGFVDHHKPIDGDHGYQFEPSEWAKRKEE